MDNFFRVFGFAQLQYRQLFTAAGINECDGTLQRVTHVQHLIFFIQGSGKGTTAGFDNFSRGEFLQIEFIDKPAGFIFIKRRRRGSKKRILLAINRQFIHAVANVAGQKIFLR